MSEQSYIIRIYRKETLSPSPQPKSGRRRHDRIAITGVIEMVAHGGRLAFHDMEGLWAVLAETSDDKNS